MDFSVEINVNVRFPGLDAAINNWLKSFVASEPVHECRCQATCKKETETETKKEKSPGEKFADKVMEACAECEKLVNAGKRERVNAILRGMRNPPVPLLQLSHEELTVFLDKLKQLEG